MKTKELVLLCSILFARMGFSQNNLSVELKFEKPSVLYKEAVFLEIIIKNNSTTDVTIDRPGVGHGSIKLIVLDSDGKELPYYGRIETTIGKSQIKVTAGNEYSYLYDLSFMYGNEPGLDYRMYSFKPGSYTMQAKYINKGELIISSRITLSVEEPQGDEKQALRIYTQAFQNIDYKDKSTKERSIASFNNFIEKYPNSRYTPGALAHAASICKIVLRDKTRADRYYYQLIEQHVSSGHVLDAFTSLKKEIQMRPDKESYLQKVLERADSSSSAHYVKEYITNLKTEIK